jgi:hypothetical protein
MSAVRLAEDEVIETRRTFTGRFEELLEGVASDPLRAAAAQAESLRPWNTTILV